MTQSTNQPGQVSAAELVKRTPKEVFAHHAQSLGAENPDATVLDYAESAVLIIPSGTIRGKSAIREFFAGVFQTLPQAHWNVKEVYEGNVLFLEWSADSPGGSVSDGVDTFIFENGLIQTQTVHFTLVTK